MTSKKTTAKDLLDWIKSWTPEQSKGFSELADSIKTASARLKEPHWATENLSGACKLHYHEDCGYSECKCICHGKETIPISKVKAKIKELEDSLPNSGDKRDLVIHAMFALKELLPKDKDLWNTVNDYRADLIYAMKELLPK